MDKSKIQTIHDWPKPQKVKDVQSFLGFANFYHWFIPEYSNITVPLTRLTCKGVPFIFSKKCHSAFKELKNWFISTLILVHWTPDLPLIIKTNASNYAIAAILSTVCSNGEVHPIAFHSCTLQVAELNYNTHDKELLAIFKVF
jgi:hypothetical protein